MSEPAPEGKEGDGEPIIVRARLVERERHRRALLSAMLRPLAGLVGVLPTARDTVSGRKRSRAIKIALIALGLFVLLAGRDHWYVVALGVAGMAAAIPLPLGELAQRSLVRRLGRAAYTTRTHTRAVTLTHDGRRLLLDDDDSGRIRRVLTNRPFGLERLGRGQDTWLAVRPGDSAKKRDAIWICVEGDPPPPELPALERGQVDTPIHVDARAEGLAALCARLEALHIRHGA